jgi:isopenicillin-N epimerase
MPTFGRSMLEHFLLDPHITYLNHGTVGVPPKRVLDKQQALRDEMERQPSRFISMRCCARYRFSQATRS